MGAGCFKCRCKACAYAQWGESILISCHTRHITTHAASHDPDAHAPGGTFARSGAGRGAPLHVPKGLPVRGSHSHSELSMPPVARTAASGDHATHSTQPLCPCARHSRLFSCEIFRPPPVYYLPTSATHSTQPLCTNQTLTLIHLFTF